jgi:hypothetical protein
MVIDFIEKNFDDYNRKSRLAPALLCFLPIILITVAFFPTDIWSWGGFINILVWFGFLRLLANFSRDRGKAREVELFKEWDGKPTTSFLRHRTTQNKIELDRLHNKLYKLTNQKFPTFDEEVKDPDLADQIYEIYVKFLLAKTRDHSKFALLYEENCTYGFRRNLFGMKPFGIITTFLGIIFIGTQVSIKIGIPKIFSNWHMYDISQLQMDLNFSACPPILYICLFINLFLFSAWVVLINSGWVKNAAKAYTIRLFESCENINPE